MLSASGTEFRLHDTSCLFVVHCVSIKTYQIYLSAVKTVTVVLNNFLNVSLVVLQLLVVLGNFHITIFLLIEFCNHFAASEIHQHRRHCSNCKKRFREKEILTRQGKTYITL